MRQGFPAVSIAFALLVASCKSTSPGGIPASADPASALTACSTSGLDSTGVKRVAVFVFDPGGKEEALRLKVLDAYAAGFLRDKRFRPVEREKLGTILREQGLSSAGFLTGEDAAKMGGVLPVDWIVSATVMRSSGKVTVSGRFLDAVNGSILQGFDCPFLVDFVAAEQTVQISQNIVNSNNTTNSNNTISNNSTTTSNTINSNNTTNSNNQNTNINIGVLNVTDPTRIIQKKCDSVHAPVIAALRNLTSPELVERAARLAMKIRFDMECGQIHFLVMDTFERYGFAPPEYGDFLIRTIDGIDDVSEDSRTQSILRYLAATDGRIDQAEWKSGFSALMRARTGSVTGYLIYLLNHRREGMIAVDRAREVLSAADAGRLGRPVPAKGGQVLYSVLSALKFDSPAGSGPFVSVLDRNSEKYAAYQYERLSFASFVSLVTAYYRFADDEGRTVMRRSLARFFAGQKNQSDRAHEHLFYDIVYGLEREANGEDGESPDRRNHAAKELQNALSDLHDPVCRAFTLYDRPTLSTRVDQIHFLLRNGVACPGLPSVSELISKAEVGDWDEKASAFRTLVEMRGNAKQAEAVAIRYFKIEGMSRSSEIRAYCAQILGYIQTTNPEAHQLLIAGAGDFDSPVQDSSEKALGRLGLLVKPAILRYLLVPRTKQDQVREIRRRMAMVQTLGRMGRNASDAIPVLNQIAATDVDSYLQRMAKTAIVNIQENRTE